MSEDKLNAYEEFAIKYDIGTNNIWDKEIMLNEELKYLTRCSGYSLNNPNEVSMNISQTHVKLQKDLKAQEDLIDKVDAYLAHVLEEFREQQINHIDLINSMSEHIYELEAKINELANSKTASTPNKSSRTHNRFQR